MIAQPSSDQLTLLVAPAKTAKLAALAAVNGISTVEMAVRLLEQGLTKDEQASEKENRPAA